MVPRDETSARVGDRLDEDPAVTLATVQERLGLSYAAAARALPRLRGERITDLLQTEPDVAPEEAATRLGYPTAVQRTALASAATELRARQVQPYLQRVADVLVGAGLAEAQDVRVQRLDGDVLAAAVTLSGSGAPALVWFERYGWRTAVSRRHPIGKDTGTPPEGEGIRYLSEHSSPNPPSCWPRSPTAGAAPGIPRPSTRPEARCRAEPADRSGPGPPPATCAASCSTRSAAVAPPAQVDGARSRGFARTTERAG
ncbi:hypothetical protein ACVB8X_39935 [Streptomyces sp. NRAIS4]